MPGPLKSGQGAAHAPSSAGTGGGGISRGGTGSSGARLHRADDDPAGHGPPALCSPAAGGEGRLAHEFFSEIFLCCHLCLFLASLAIYNIFKMFVCMCI